MPTELLEPRTVKRKAQAKRPVRPQSATTNDPDKPLAADCLRFRCPACAKPIRAKTSAAGKKGRCPSCREALRFPQAEGVTSAPQAKPVRQAHGGPAAVAPVAKPAVVAKAPPDRRLPAPKAERSAPKARTKLHEPRSEKPRRVPSAERTSPPSAAHPRRGPSPAVMAFAFAAGLALGAAGGRWSVSPGSPFAVSPEPVAPVNQPGETPAAREFSPGEQLEAPASGEVKPAASATHTLLPTEPDSSQTPALTEVPAPEPKAVARAETPAEPAEAAAREIPQEASPATAILEKTPAKLPEPAVAPAVSQAMETKPAPAEETALKHAPDEEAAAQPQEILGKPEAVVEAPAQEKAEPIEVTPATVGVEHAEPSKPAAVPAEPSVVQGPAKPAVPPERAEDPAEAPATIKPAEAPAAKVSEAPAGVRRFANARDLHEAVDTRYQGDDGQWRTTLVLTNKRGEKRVRELQRFRKEENHLAKVLLFYLAPSDIKGTSTLTIEQEGDDDLQRMWLPALKKNRRIAGSDKGKSWAGTDFTYEDLRERKVEDYTYGALSEETVDGQPCWRYELKPVTEDKSSYGRIEQWVRKDNLEPIFVKFYDKKDRFFKELRFRRLVKVQGVWASLHWEMINHEDEHKTEFFVTRARYNQGLGEDHFSPRAMTELPGDFEGESFEWGSK